MCVLIGLRKSNMNAISGCKTYCFTPDLIETLYHFKVTKGAISKRKSVSDKKKKRYKGCIGQLKKSDMAKCYW